ncbi:hypothetical protein IWW55_004483, partial [Coemansia sp. RSA 2706]
MISTTAVHALAERKTRNLLNMRPGWLKKDVGAAMPVGSTQSPVSSKIGELAASRSKSKSLSRPRIRELLTSAMI